MLLIPEIFSVGDYIRAAANDLTGLGYVVAAPDLFWRLRPGFSVRHDEEDVRTRTAAIRSYMRQARPPVLDEAFNVRVRSLHQTGDAPRRRLFASGPS